MFALTCMACEPSPKTSEKDMSEPVANTFSLRELDPVLVERVPLGDTPCIGYAPLSDLKSTWGLRLRAQGDFPHPPGSPSIQPGTDGISSQVKSASLHLVHSDGDSEDVSQYFSSPQHCLSLASFEGMESEAFSCLLLTGDEYSVWSSNGKSSPAYTKATTPQGSKEELYFRSIHADFPSYAQAFNDEDGVRMLGVEVVFWANDAIMTQVKAGDQLAITVTFKDGSKIEEQVAF